jgi:hypothetical protein
LTKRRVSSSSSSSSSERKRKREEKYISFKKRKTKSRTHHTPTQEYVVPKSIPIAGPSDLDMFVCLCVCVFLVIFYECRRARERAFFF